MSENQTPPAIENSVKTLPKQENGFANLIFNIFLPIFILNKLSDQLGPLKALILALLFPLGYGIYDLIKRKKTNFFSILGLFNVLLTGGLALFHLNGFWFAVKEAAFPSLVGAFVFGSAFTKKPFIETLFLNPNLIKVDLLETRLEENGYRSEFHQHMRMATMLLALSFAFSAVLNFILARRIFIDIDLALAEEAQSLIRNEQIADMTFWSMIIIMGPSILFLMGIFWYLMTGIKKYAGLSTTEVIREN
jgi:hypothetical protein